MINLKNFTRQKKINQSQYVDVIRTFDEKNKRDVIIKYVSSDPNSLRYLINLQNEYEILKYLNSEYSIQAYSLEKLENGYGLIMEDGGISLKEYKKVLSVEEFLLIGVKIAEILSYLHRKRIVHKDIKPSNFVINPKTNQVKIVDFGISTRLSKEDVGFKPVNGLEGSLYYISPEQTGRVNKMIDYRTDFYSLGIMFYELLTGNVPFTSDDPNELVYCHITKHPERISLIRKEVPIEISVIVETLLSKDPDNRYQNALGLKHDLLRVRDIITAKTDKVPILFSPRMNDISDKFQIPQKLYGRDQEINHLLSIFNSTIESHSQILLVSGYSGIGKSSFINETHKPITQRKGYFLHGKFDQFQRNIPFSAILQAFKGLITFLLSESEIELNKWKEKIVTSLAANAQVIIDVIPELEMIIGKQEPVPELGAVENLNRFNLTIQKFISIFAEKEHPIVLFVDDLQWADIQSLNFIKLQITDKTSRNLLILGAYRDNEVDPTHPLTFMIQEIQEAGRHINTIHLGPLSKSDISQLLSDAFQTEKISSNLIELIHKKTGGNPLFLSELLKKLHKEELIYFDYNNNEWKWEESKILSYGITDNVIDLMIDTLKNFSPETLYIISLAACLGNKFSLNMLSVISKKSETESAALLMPAVEEGILIPEEGDIELRNLASPDKMNQENVNSTITIRFQHDRVLQAVYLLIDENEKKKVHLLIGNLLLKNFTPGKQEDNLFELVEHLNRAKDLINEEERIKLAELNLFAANRANKSAAFNSALLFCNNGISLLKDSDWKLNHDLTWNLHFQKASNSFSCAYLEESEETIKLALSYSITEEEKVHLYQVYLNVLFQLNRHQEGILIFIEAWKFLGVHVPKKVTKAHIAAEYLKFKFNMGFKKIEDLLSLPEIKNKTKLNILKIGYDAIPSAFMVNADLFGYISVLMANISITYGISMYAPFAFIMVAIVQVGATKEFKSAHKMLELSIHLNQKYPSLDVKGRIFLVACSFVIFWVRPADECMKYLTNAILCLKETGNLHWRNYSITFTRVIPIFYSKNHLQNTWEEDKHFYSEFIKTKDKDIILNKYFLLSFIGKLTGISNGDLINPYNYDEDDYAKSMENMNNYTIKNYYYLIKVFEEYTFENYQTAYVYAKISNSILFDALGSNLDHIARFYSVLTILRNFNNLDEIEKIKIKFHHEINKKLLETASKNSKENFYAHYLLILAEEANVKGNNELAIDFYTKAIGEAIKTGFLHTISLSYELTAKFFFEKSNLELAGFYMTKALESYEKWGARKKCNQLKDKYREILGNITNRFPDNNDENVNLPLNDITGNKYHTLDTSKSPSSTFSQSLDLSAIIKSSRIISGEINLENLIQNFSQILIENAGAERVVIVSCEENALTVELEGTETSKIVFSDKPIPLLNAADMIPISIVQYVARTKATIVLNDAYRDSNYLYDQYIQKNKVKSLLCIPVISKSSIIAIIYLENNLTSGVFTEERMEILNSLAIQAGISFENARLYKTLSQKESQYRTLIENLNVGIYRNTGAKEVFLQANPAMAKIFGYDDVKDFLKVQASDIYENPADRKILLDILEKQGYCKNLELKLKRKNGTTFFASCSATAIYDENKTIQWIDGVIEDITELKLATEKLIQFNKTLENKVNERTSALLEAKAEVDALNYFTHLINSLSDLNEIFTEISKYVYAKYNISGSWLLLPDEKREYLYVYKAYNYFKIDQGKFEYLKNLQIPLNEKGGIPFLTFNRKKPLYLPKIKRFEFAFDKEMVETLSVKSCLYVPLTIKNKCIGIYAFSNLNNEMKLSKKEVNSISNLGSQIAGVIQTTHLLQIVEKAKTQTEELNLLIKSLNEETDLNKIMEKVKKYIKDIFSIEHYALYSTSSAKNKIKLLLADIPEHISEEDRNTYIKMEIPISGIKGGAHSLAIHAKKPTFFSKVRKTGVTEEELFIIEKSGCQSFLLIPLILQNKPIGLLNFFNVGKMKLSKTEIAKLSILGEQLTGIIHGSNLFKQVQEEKEKVEKASFKIEKLNQFTKLANSTSNLDTMLEFVFKYIEQEFHIDAGIILLKDKNKEEFYSAKQLYTTASDLVKEQSIKLRVPLNESGGIIYKTYNRKKTTHIPNRLFESIFNKEYEGIKSDKDLVKNLELQSFILIPLIVQNQVIGITMLTSYIKPLNLKKKEIYDIEGFCEHIAGMIYTQFLKDTAEQEKKNAETEKGIALIAKQEAEKQKQETEELNQLIKSLNEEIDLKIILGKVSNYVKTNFGIQYLALNIVNQDKTYCTPMSVSFPDYVSKEEQKTILNFKIPIQNIKGIHAYTIRLKKPLYFSKIRKYGITKEELYVIDKFKMKSVLIIPLLLNNEPIGILEFSNSYEKMDLSGNDITRLSILGEQLAGIIYGSNLFKQVQEEKEKALSAQQDAEKERQKSDKLLLNILPKDVASELKEKGFSEPVLFENVSVLFTDFKGFTQIAEGLSPKELVEELDRCFSYFDSLMERYGLEKLKTIGDSYMCAGGIPKRNVTHALDYVMAALEIQAIMKQMKDLKAAAGKSYWELRLGIHSGPLVAGVIGEKKFAYDVWGDTVNTASRMESSGTPGMINISGTTYGLVKEFFDCEYRGRVKAKNKGEVDMYYVYGLKPEFSQKGDGKTPNGKFWEKYGLM